MDHAYQVPLVISVTVAVRVTDTLQLYRPVDACHLHVHCLVHEMSGIQDRQLKVNSAAAVKNRRACVYSTRTRETTVLKNVKVHAPESGTHKLVEE
jgi:hypothetical protein